MPVPSPKRTRTVSMRWNAVSAYVYKVRQGRGHRGRRPAHADKGMIRELGRASSLPVHENADQCGVTPVGVHRDIKAPCRKGPPLRRVDPQSATKSGGDRYGGTSWIAKELRTSVRQSYRIMVAMAERTPHSDKDARNCPVEPARRASAQGIDVPRRRRRASPPTHG